MVKIETIQAFWSGIVIGFRALFSLFPIYQQMNNVKTEILAVIFGVPAFVIVVVPIVIKVVRFFLKNV